MNKQVVVHVEKFVDDPSNSHTQYIVSVTTSTRKQFDIRKTYSEFIALYDVLKVQFPEVAAFDMPLKSYFFSSFTFLKNARMKCFGQFLNLLLDLPLGPPVELIRFLEPTDDIFGIEVDEIIPKVNFESNNSATVVPATKHDTFEILANAATTDCSVSLAHQVAVQSANEPVLVDIPEIGINIEDLDEVGIDDISSDLDQENPIFDNDTANFDMLGNQVDEATNEYPNNRHLVEGVNSVGSDGKTALHLAVEFGKLALVQLIIEQYDGDIGVRSADGHSLLFVASSHGHVDIVFYLLGLMEELDCDDIYDCVTAAAVGGHRELITLFLDCSPEVLEMILCDSSIDALRGAVAAGHVDVLEYLLSIGVPFQTDSESALLVAIKHQQLHAAECLLRHGAQADYYPENSDNEVLHCSPPLLLTASMNDVYLTELLLKYHGNGNIHNGELQTALHVAACVGGIDVMRVLIGCNINVNARDVYGKSPAVYAIENHQAEFFIDFAHVCSDYGLLIEVNEPFNKNLDMTIQDDGSNQVTTLLHEAILVGIPAIVKLLLDLGANVNSKNYQKNTPLQLACESGVVPIIECLLSHRSYADYEFQFEDNKALYLAFRYGHVDTVQLLLDHCADPANAWSALEHRVLTVSITPSTVEESTDTKANIMEEEAIDDVIATTLIHNLKAMKTLLLSSF